jgi:hypothetical protein
MKLGILTFHSAHNYGATLQAYGLQEYLKSLGHEVYIIDYRPDYIVKCYPRDSHRSWLSKNPMMCLRRLWMYIRYSKIRHLRWDNFNKFINNQLSLSSYVQGMDCHEYDAVFFGSDQVWSPYHTGGQYDEIFFGYGFRCKSISYAPSCSQSDLTVEQRNRLATLLESMTSISVREQKFKDILSPLTTKSITVVVDPSLLAGRDVYDRIANPIRRKRPYVLIYEIKQHKEVYNMAQWVAGQLNADLVELTNGMLNFHRKSMDEAASPEDFLGYIKNASCVITTSFHGTAFSLLFHIPFYVVRQSNDADIRMESLLKALNLENRMVNIGDTPIFSATNMDTVDAVLQSLRETSQNFIKESLS